MYRSYLDRSSETKDSQARKDNEEGLIETYINNKSEEKTSKLASSSASVERDSVVEARLSISSVRSSDEGVYACMVNVGNKSTLWALYNKTAFINIVKGMYHYYLIFM